MMNSTNSFWGLDFSYACRIYIIGPDLIFPAGIGRLISAKYCEKQKWKINIQMQRIGRHFTRLYLSAVEIYIFIQSYKKMVSAYCILFWWVIRKDGKALSELPFLVLCVCKLDVVPYCVCVWVHCVYVCVFPYSVKYSCKGLSPGLNTCFIGSISEFSSAGHVTYNLHEVIPLCLPTPCTHRNHSCVLASHLQQDLDGEGNQFLVALITEMKLWW